VRTVIPFNDDWTVEVPGSEPCKINLPHTWNGRDGQDGGNDYKRCKARYTKCFKKPEISEGGCCLLVFNGVNSEAEVILNGKKLCRHEGGYSRFCADITSSLKEANLLEVYVSNEKNPTVYPQRADFTFYGGIYRDVTLEIFSENSFMYGECCSPFLKITPEVCGSDGVLTVSATVRGKGEAYVSVLDADGRTVAEGKTDEIIAIKDVRLWNGTKDPYLYTVKAELYADGKKVDETQERTGFRAFSVDSENGFLLNGRAYPLRGVCRHQDRPEKGNAIGKAEHEEDMALIHEIGANTVRLAHYQQDDYVYSLCDKYGFVVWAEIPYISKHEPSGNANTKSQLRELILQNYNHPSICFWGLSNEITMMRTDKGDMVRNHEELNELCYKLDSSRLTTLACFAACGFGNKTAHITDVVSWNVYFGWYTPFKWLNKLWFGMFHKLYKNRCVGLSEYGAEAMPNLHSLRPRRGDNTEEYQTLYHEYMAKFISGRPYMWATHVWNMFDFAADGRNQGGEPGRNHKGLVTFDRKTKKDAFYLYKAYWSEEPFVHICGKRFVNRTGKRLKIKVYSNQRDISLYCNGKFVARKCGSKVFEFTLPMAERNEIEVRSEALSESAVFIKVKKKDPSYKEKNLGFSASWEKG